MTTKKRKACKPKPTYKVYVTYYPTGEYYIGFSSKMGAAYDKYFGSNKDILESVKNGEHCFTKETLFESDKKSFARAVEAIYQWENRNDPRCLNDMWNVRLRLSHLKDLVIPDWKPKIPESE